MTVQHYLISQFDLDVWTAWGKLYKVIASDIIIIGHLHF